jgi:hypothetical protein
MHCRDVNLLPLVLQACERFTPLSREQQENGSIWKPVPAVVQLQARLQTRYRLAHTPRPGRSGSTNRLVIPTRGSLYQQPVRSA